MIAALGASASRAASPALGSGSGAAASTAASPAPAFGSDASASTTVLAPASGSGASASTAASPARASGSNASPSTTAPRAHASWPAAALRVAVHPAVRVLDGGRVLMGGEPFRLLRLTAAGAEAIADWQSPGPVGAAPARRALARRLLDAGILAARPAPDSGPAFTVVVPVRDRAAQLARCLDSLRAADGRATIVVVDDGSADPDAVRTAASARGARVIRHDVPAGAAAARNTGLAASTTPVVAFVDSDVVVPADWAPRLLGHFADPCVGAVAPRIRALPPARGLIGRYESRHSPLDMGAEPAFVGPGRTIPYVPSAVLAVRRAAAGGGFDAAMPIGEDVDLVWRLVERRWRVVYSPDVEVRHDHRLRLRAFVDRRRVYASSVAPLARRHPGALPAAHLSAWTAVPWALLLAGSRRAAFAATLVEVGLVARRLSAVPGAEPRLAAALVARGLLASGAGLGRAARRAWAPALGVAAVRHRSARRTLALAFAAAIAEDAVHARRLPPGDVVVRALDEAVALWGTWEGCIRHRTLAPLLPAWHDRASDAAFPARGARPDRIAA